jgi:[ribosomal protein S5]-alanine N-acetyltransferase
MHLETARLLLREYEAGDYDDLREIDGDPEVQRYRGGHTITEEQTRGWIARTEVLRREEPRTRYPLVLARKDGGEVVGACLLNVSSPERREAELGYLVKRRHWGRGYTTEAARAVLGFGFGTLGLHRVWAQANPQNPGSWRVMEKLGMRREGHLREAELTASGEWRDVYLYAILDHEWRAQ